MVIQEVGEKFISTWIIIHDATALAEKGYSLAKTVTASWEYPVDIMFLSAEGQLLSKLNSFKDFPDVNPDVATPPGKNVPPGRPKQSHAEVFQQFVARTFGSGQGDLK